MWVKLADLEKNPFRDFTVDPIDLTVLEELKASIAEDGFWGGIVCRRSNGHIQIGAGHHRVVAAMQAGITQADVFVADDMSDAGMIRVYARENATQRGNTGTAVAGMIASAIKYLARAILTGDEALSNILGRSPEEDSAKDENLSKNLDRFKRAMETLRGNLTSAEGIGEPVITTSRLLEHVPRVNKGSIGQQLAILKSSGDYARIIAEVEAELEREHQEALAALEASEREQERLEQERKEAEARQKVAEEEQRQAQLRAQVARKAAQEKRAAEEAQKEKLAQERARIEQELAEKRKAELAQEREAFKALGKKETTIKKALPEAHKATAHAEETNVKTFDFEGVAKHLKNVHQIDVFRDEVLKPGVREVLPIDQQAALAAHLVEMARTDPTRRRKEISAEFIHEKITFLLFEGKWGARREATAEKEELLRQDLLTRAHHVQDEFVKKLWAALHAGDALEKLWKEWPTKKLAFPFDPRIAEVIKHGKDAFEKLAQRI